MFVLILTCEAEILIKQMTKDVFESFSKLFLKKGPSTFLRDNPNA